MVEVRLTSSSWVLGGNFLGGEAVFQKAGEKISSQNPT
jgi:hypothetical protein